MPAQPPQSQLTDWITAVATAATALAAGIAGFIAWLAYRRDQRLSLPTVEAVLRWVRDQDDDFILLKLIIRNPLWETIILESAHAKYPQSTLISSKYENINGEMTPIKKGESSYTDIDDEIYSYGSTSDFYPGRSVRADVYHRDIYLLPPRDWSGDKVRIDLFISSRALTLRHKRVTIKRRISPRPSKQTEANARSAG